MDPSTIRGSFSWPGSAELASVLGLCLVSLVSRVAVAQPDAATSAMQVEWAAPTAPAPPRPAGGGPVEMELTLSLNKVSEIDTVAETYHVDSYLQAKWLDPTAVKLLLREGGERSVYLDDVAGELMGRVIWWPDLELINTVGGRNRTDVRLEVLADGHVLYNERFQAKLSSDMDFRQFPFDSQAFEILFESYTYREDDLIFVHPHADLGHLQEAPSPDWSLSSPQAAITRHKYADGWYSRYAMTLDADRLPGYFVWQVFLPLILILGTSWIVFWLTEMSDKISVAFTCLLTIVAFNFYTSTMLPQLPYNTFIEAIVISAYVATFFLIGYILVADRYAAAGKEAVADRMFKVGRWLVPASYGLSVVVNALIFF